jgi:hypothetical protein
MIITSNSVEHNYSVSNLSIIGEVDGLQKVAYQAIVYLTSSTTFEHTYETTIYDMESSSGITTTVTENKTVRHFTYYNVDLSTQDLDPNSFTAWEDLEEDQVLQWCFDAYPDTLKIRQENEDIVLIEKDKVLNPLKYYKDTPPTPWKIRQDQQSHNNNQELLE